MKMEHHKISNLLNDSMVSKFLTRKWIKLSDLSNGQYSVYKNVRLWSNFCDYSDVYIVAKMDNNS